MAGLVNSAGRQVEKAGELLAADAPFAVAPALAVCRPRRPEAGRGPGRVRRFTRGPVCADIGASTGGFTDCLLQRGAARVFAVDVSTRQIDDRLRRDPRVVLIEKNARNLARAIFPNPSAWPSWTSPSFRF